MWATLVLNLVRVKPEKLLQRIVMFMTMIMKVVEDGLRVPKHMEME